MIRLYVILILSLFLNIRKIWAESWSYDWAPVSGASAYEFEIATKNNFESASLVKQGQVSLPKVAQNLSTGIYYFRVRSLFAKSKPSPWSQGMRFVVQSESSRILRPAANENVQISSIEKSSIAFAWEPVDSVTEYVLDLKGPSGKQIQQVAVQTEAQVSNLVPGSWSVTVSARSQGEILSTSKPISFQVTLVQFPKAQFLYPLENQLVEAELPIEVQWKRKVPGTKSVLLVKRLHPEPVGILYKYELQKDETKELPGLAPGRYQVTLQEWISDNENNVQETLLTFRSEHDPFLKKKTYLGTHIQFEGGPTWAWYATRHPQMPDPQVWQKNDLFTPGTEAKFSLEQRILPEWSVHASIDETRFKEVPVNKVLFPETTNEKLSEPMKFWNLRLGAAYLTTPLTADKPLTHRASVFYKGVHTVAKPSHGGRDPAFVDYVLWGLHYQGELIWGGWNPAWDFPLRLGTEIPVWVGGKQVGVGYPIPLPTLFGGAYLRRKFWRDYAWAIGTDFHLERILIYEKFERYYTQQDYTGFAPKLRLELKF